MAKPEPTTLKRLGAISFWRGQEKCLDALRKIYRQAMESAQRKEQSLARKA